jgi:hypothetical protein
MERKMTHEKVQHAFTTSSKSASVIASNNKIDRSNTLEIYRTMFPENGAYDVTHFQSPHIKFQGLVELLTENEWFLLKDDQIYNVKKSWSFPYHQVWLHTSGCLFEYAVVNTKINGVRKHNDADIIWIGEDYVGSYDKEGGELCLSDAMLISPLGRSAKIKDLISSITSSLACAEKSTSSKIGIVSHDGREHYVKDFLLEDKDSEFNHLDLHYGAGFEEFHQQLLGRIVGETKGLILLHGEPGTGKTQYIRALLREISTKSKRVLYVPPSFAAQLMEPGMIDFIGDWVTEEDSDVIMLIEDAEPLLETRNGDGRSTGISNLLNMTDGILNDMLGLMVIATFNTELHRIDSALLRPQRLIARKEFTRIDKERAIALAKELHFDCPDIQYPATLADFYTVKKSQEILVHGVADKGKSIGFK